MTSRGDSKSSKSSSSKNKPSSRGDNSYKGTNSYKNNKNIHKNNTQEPKDNNKDISPILSDFKIYKPVQEFDAKSNITSPTISDIEIKNLEHMSVPRKVLDKQLAMKLHTPLIKKEEEYNNTPKSFNTDDVNRAINKQQKEFNWYNAINKHRNSEPKLYNWNEKTYNRNDQMIKHEKTNNQKVSTNSTPIMKNSPLVKMTETSSIASTLTTKKSDFPSMSNKGTQKTKNSKPGTSKSMKSNSSNSTKTSSRSSRNDSKDNTSYISGFPSQNEESYQSKSSTIYSRSHTKRESKKSKSTCSNKSNIQDNIPETIREGQNKFHALGEVDPEDYIHPNYWKTINQITEKTKAPALIKRSVISSKLVWSGDLEKFTTYKKIITGHCRQSGAGYIVQSKFLDLYEQDKDNILDHYKTITPEQLEYDKEWLYGMLESSMRGHFGMTQLMKHEEDKDGVMVWIELLDTCDKGGNKEIRIEKLEQIIPTQYNRNYKGAY